MEKYECPICYELMKAPIFICTQGHSICSNCKSRLRHCPTCKSKWSGARNYFLEQLIQQVFEPHSEVDTSATTTKKLQIAIKSCNELAKWDDSTRETYIKITSYKKESDITGIFSYIVYSVLHSSATAGKEVCRKNKQFQWLYDKMKEKFVCIAIPPLPKEKIFGKFDSQVVERRRFQLQEFLNYICRHPVLSTSSLWNHFLCLTDDVMWEKGKDSILTDPFTGSNLYLNITVPEKNIRTNEVKIKLDEHLKFIVAMEEALTYLYQVSNNQHDKHCHTYNDLFYKIGKNFIRLGENFGENTTHSVLAQNIKLIGSTYTEVGNLYSDRATICWQPLVDMLSLYKGVTSSLHNVIKIRNEKAEKEKRIDKNISDTKRLEERKRVGVMTYTVFAEVAHYQSDCDKMFKLLMKNFLLGQVNFYKHIVRKLENTLQVL